MYEKESLNDALHAYEDAKRELETAVENVFDYLSSGGMTEYKFTVPIVSYMNQGLVAGVRYYADVNLMEYIIQGKDGRNIVDYIDVIEDIASAILGGKFVKQ